jgi:hypothetical protein
MLKLFALELFVDSSICYSFFAQLFFKKKLWKVIQMMMEITHNHKSESKIPRDVRYPVHD